MNEAPHEGRGESSPSPALDPRRALEGALFPLSRRHLVLVARENEAPARLLSLLSSLPERAYGELGEVLEALHWMEKGP